MVSTASTSAVAGTASASTGSTVISGLERAVPQLHLDLGATPLSIKPSTATMSTTIYHGDSRDSYAASDKGSAVGTRSCAGSRACAGSAAVG